MCIVLWLLTYWSSSSLLNVCTPGEESNCLYRPSQYSDCDFQLSCFDKFWQFVLPIWTTNTLWRDRGDTPCLIHSTSVWKCTSLSECFASECFGSECFIQKWNLMNNRLTKFSRVFLEICLHAVLPCDYEWFWYGSSSDYDRHRWCSGLPHRFPTKHIQRFAIACHLQVMCLYSSKWRLYQGNNLLNSTQERERGGDEKYVPKALHLL